MTKLALLISKIEGFGRPGAIPTTHNNPGDLRHSPHSSHPGDPNAIGQIDTVADGWADLERQLRLNADRGMTLRECIESWAPPSDGNDTQEYLQMVCDGLALPPETPLRVALQIQADSIT